MYKLKTVFLILFAILVSCGTKNTSTKPSYKIDVNNYLQEFCHPKNNENYLLLKKLKFSAVNELVSFYQNRNFKSVWVDNYKQTPVFSKAISLLKNSMSYGLDTVMYLTGVISETSTGFSDKELTFNANLNVIATELLTTHSMLLFLQHLQFGIFTPDSAIYDKMVTPKFDSIPIFLEKSITANDLSICVNWASPKNPHYREIQLALASYLTTAKINHLKYPIPYFAKDSTGCKKGVEKMLQVHGYIEKSEVGNPQQVSKALVKFQTEFGLRNRGRYDTLTVETLSKSTFDFYRSACITLQRLRWSNISDKYYLLVNIPSFTLHFVEEGEIAISHKIVGGKPDHQTPELNSRLSHFILFPEWNVPHKISTKELLPSIQANPSYLQKNNYEIINGKNEVVDASKINWKKFNEKNFPYRIRQSSGDGNSLGIIKFYFNNKHGVYLHDTPSKSLFNLNYRAFSHGCMRVHNPFDFAKSLLEFNKGMLHLPKEKLLKLKKFEQQEKFQKYRKNIEKMDEVKEMERDVVEVKNTIFTIKRPLPIYIRYLTAFVDEKSNLKFYPDLYHKDSLFIEKFNKAVKSNTLF